MQDLISKNNKSSSEKEKEHEKIKKGYDNLKM